MSGAWGANIAAAFSFFFNGSGEGKVSFERFVSIRVAEDILLILKVSLTPESPVFSRAASLRDHSECLLMFSREYYIDIPQVKKSIRPNAFQIQPIIQSFQSTPFLNIEILK